VKQVEVTILGQNYTLASPDDGDSRLAEAVASVDREMSAIKAAGKTRARERIAVLAALNLAYQLAEQNIRGAAPAVATFRAPPETRTPAEESSGVDIEGLLSRVNSALSEDGQLL